jgi:hypothetical protein
VGSAETQGRNPMSWIRVHIGKLTAHLEPLR